MRIALDVTGALGRPSGMRRYAEELLAALAAVDGENEYLVYAAFWRDWPRLLTEGFRIPKAANVRALPLRIPQQVLLPAEHWLGLRLQERALRKAGVDIVHGLANVLPRLSRLKSVVTLHHVATPEEHGELLEKTSPWSRFYFHDLTERSLRAADRVIAISGATREDALKAYGLAPDRVTAVWSGVSAEAFAGPDDAELRRSLGIDAPYLLFVSAINTRKNLERLARAFAALKSRRSIPHKLVLVGARHASAASVAEEIRRSGLSESALFLEGLGDAELRSLYRGCSLFVYPSLLEGFGLPMLEAMACGAPVAAAHASCLPEIAADAAHYFDGSDENDMSAQIERALFDEPLRSALIAKGRERVRAFDWKETARKTLEVYREVFAGLPPG